MLIEAKRFFGLEESPLPDRIKTQGKLLIIDIERLRTVEKNGIETAMFCAEKAKEFFKHTDKKVMLTKSPALAMVDEHIEFGRIRVTNREGQEEWKSTLWYIHGRSRRELNHGVIFEMANRDNIKAIQELERQTPERVCNKFIATIQSALK